MMMIFHWVAWLDSARNRPNQRSEFCNYCNRLAPGIISIVNISTETESASSHQPTCFSPLDLRGRFASHWADQLRHVSSQWTHHNLQSMSRIQESICTDVFNLGHVDFRLKEHLYHHLSLYVFPNLKNWILKALVAKGIGHSSSVSKFKQESNKCGIKSRWDFITLHT